MYGKFPPRDRIFLEDVLPQMPQEVREWCERLSGDAKYSVEYKITMIGVRNFIETFAFQKEEQEYYDNF